MQSAEPGNGCVYCKDNHGISKARCKADDKKRIYQPLSLFREAEDKLTIDTKKQYGQKKEGYRWEKTERRPDQHKIPRQARKGHIRQEIDAVRDKYNKQSRKQKTQKIAFPKAGKSSSSLKEINDRRYTKE